MLVLSFYRSTEGVQRGRSPFCRVFEGVPQNYHHEGGWAGKRALSLFDFRGGTPAARRPCSRPAPLAKGRAAGQHVWRGTVNRPVLPYRNPNRRIQCPRSERGRHGLRRTRLLLPRPAGRRWIRGPQGVQAPPAAWNGLPLSAGMAGQGHGTG